jgi:kynurenine formamidase
MEIIGTIQGRPHKLIYPGSEISILQTFGADQPSHFGAQEARATPLIAGDFKGNTEEGGSCNVYELKIVPHCNGTHTETSEHIEKQGNYPAHCLGQPFYPGRLVTIGVVEEAVMKAEGEHYEGAEPPDLLITKKSLLKAGNWYSSFLENGAVVIRTIPNPEAKKTAKWDITQKAPYFSEEAIQFLGGLSIKHLIVDFPSLDKTHDGGRLKNHREFFKDTLRTVSEMAFIPDAIKDGNYFVSIQVPFLAMDATPSRLVLYHAKEVL